MMAVRAAWLLVPISCAIACAPTAAGSSPQGHGDALEKRVQAAAPQPSAAERVGAADQPPSAAGASCEHAGAEHACGADHVQTAPTAGLVRITDRDAMCMLSNRYLGERQDVPVTVAGKTYHGCCANCAARLGQVAELRHAVDPVSGQQVDKGTAVIARDPQNKLLYFESEASLAAYSAR